MIVGVEKKLKYRSNTSFYRGLCMSVLEEASQGDSGLLLLGNIGNVGMDSKGHTSFLFIRVIQTLY